MSTEELIARKFHEVYDHSAEGMGWWTQPETRVPWDELPEPNRNLMLTTVGVLLEWGVIAAGPNLSRAGEQRD